MQRHFAFDALDRVGNELDAGRYALSTVLASLKRHAQDLIAAQAAGVTSDELRRCAVNLEVTFILRLFAEFEGILRDYWRDGLGKKTTPRMSDLMESTARHRGMSDDALAVAHEIREYRNDIIHENRRDGRFDFEECARAIGRYLSWLPIQW